MPSSAARRKINALDRPDEDDRHVLAAAVAARADILCTDNIKDIPRETMDTVGMTVSIAFALRRVNATRTPDLMAQLLGL